MKTDEGHRALLKLRTAFDDYLVAEVNRFGGIPRKLSQQMVFENAVAELLEAEEAAALLTAPLETVQPHLRRKADEWDARAKVLRAQTRLDDAELVESLAHELREAALTAQGGVPPSPDDAQQQRISTALRGLLEQWQQSVAELRARIAELESAGGVPPWEQLKDAAEMLWVVLANVSGGDWTQQSQEWQDAAARWRDNYFAALTASLAPPGTPSPEARACPKHGPLVGVRYCPECAVGSTEGRGICSCGHAVTEHGDPAPRRCLMRGCGCRKSRADVMALSVGSTEDEQDTKTGSPGTPGRDDAKA